MLRSTIAHFRQLRSPIKAMVYLHWIYSFVSALTGVFVQIYLYELFGSVTFNILAQVLYFTGCALGFSLIGWLASLYRANMKWGYAWAFLVLCGSFLLLHGEVTQFTALMFMLVNGIGLGLYWVTLHTFELTETKDHERDYYSSMLSAGDQMIELTAPALATLLLYISGSMLHLGNFTLLFIVSPILYVCGIPLFRHIRSYRPGPIDKEDFDHFLHDRKNRKAQVYLFAGSMNYAFARVVLPIAAIMFLKSETHVGLFNTAFAIISAMVLVVLSRRRHSGNRLDFLFGTSLAAVCVTIFLAFRFDLAAFIIFSLLSVIIKPLQRVSAHVIDLETMETLGLKGKDFFATMIFRDAAFGIWRVLSLALFALLIFVVGEGAPAVRLGFVGLAGSTALLYFGATLLYKK